MTRAVTMKLSELLPLCQGELIIDPEGGDTEVSGMGLNAQEIGEGELFAGVPGTHVHGAKFAGQSKAAAIITDADGAKLLHDAGETRPVIKVTDVRAAMGPVADAIYGEPSKDLTIIGITGTSGKTTTSYLLEAGLMAAGLSVGLIGTTGTRINGEKVPTKLTTPEAPTLQRLFAMMRDRGATHVVMEVSSHAIALGRVGGTRFAANGFTNLSQDHLDFHPTMEDYFQTKARFFKPDSPLRADHCVVCVDDEWGQRMAELAGAGVRTVNSTGGEADIVAGAPEVDATGAQHFDLALGERHLDVDLPLPGYFNVANASLAIALGAAVGVDATKLAHGIAHVAVPGRMERIGAGQEFLAVVDYAHKPAAIAAVLETLRGQVDGRIGIVVGAGGDRDISKRPIMGAEAVRGADFVVITDDNPRTEDPAAIRQAVLAGASEAAEGRQVSVEEVGDRSAAIRAAVEWARPGDAIVVAGKGHETGQLVGTTNHHFDDREELRRHIEALQ